MTFLWFILAWVLCGQVGYQILRFYDGPELTRADAIKDRLVCCFLGAVVIGGACVVTVKECKPIKEWLNGKPGRWL